MGKTLEVLWQKKVKKLIGLNSGTSCDGIDAAIIEITGHGPETKARILAYENYKYSSEVRNLITSLFSAATGRVDRICSMNFYLGEIFAEAALKIIAAAGLTPDDIDLIGSHGQTVYHIPEKTMIAGIPVRSTLQIGEPAIIAERTGIVTVADFRVRDIAAGGHGAPLIPYVDYLLFGQEGKPRIIQNIGGIANLSFVGGGVKFNEILAFDTGPGNMVIDGMVWLASGGQMNYDRDGELAGAGQVSKQLLDGLLRHPYFSLSPPKTTGRELFGLEYTKTVYERGKALQLSDNDMIATVTAFTAETIALHYEKYIFPKIKNVEVIIGGGGAYNPTLLAMLRKRIAPVPVFCHEDFGISSDGKEALAFAILANETIHQRTANVPSATGATHQVILGKIIL